MFKLRPWRLSRTRDALLHMRVKRWRRDAGIDSRRRVEADSGAIVIGALSSVSGIAQGARLMAAQFHAQGRSCLTRDLSHELQLDARLPFAAQLSAQMRLPPLPRVIHLNPPHLIRALALLGKTVFEAPVIAYWAWELPSAPKQWQSCLSLLDEIWVPSPFVYRALTHSFSRHPHLPEIRIKPHALAAPVRASVEQRQTVRHALGLAETDLLAGFSFSTLAGVRRKNPEALIRAFQQAFAAREHSAKLLLRVSDSNKHPDVIPRLRSLCGDDARIHIITAEQLPIGDFFAALDTLASLHRAEGYGLLLAEALALEIPVIACDWELSGTISAHPLFRAVSHQLVAVHDPGGPYQSHADQQWAEPDSLSAATHMRELWLRKQAQFRPDADRRPYL